MSRKKHQAKLSNIGSMPDAAKPLFGWLSESLIKNIILCLSLGLPFVVFATSSSFLYPTVFPKTILFYAIIEIIIALFLVLALADKKYWPRLTSTDAGGKKQYNWILILASAYFATTVISTLFSPNTYNSFFGTVDFGNGLLTITHFWGLFIILSSVFQEKQFWLSFVRLNICAGSVMSIVAFYQKFVSGVPATGTFGNPSYLSGYLLFTISLSALLFFWSKTKGAKITWAGLGALNLAALFLTTITRGSQLGLLVGLTTAIIIYFLAHPKRLVRRAALGLALVALISSLTLATFVISSDKIYALVQRSDTIVTRITNWKIALKGFAEKPVFGYGPENYHIVFEKHFDPLYYQQQSSEYGFSLPHNKFVEIAVLGGTVSLVAYLSLFAAMFWQLFRKFSRTRDKSLLAIFVMWTAYLVHLFFLFDNISSFFMFFSLLAFTSFILREPTTENESEPTRFNPVFAYSLLAIIVLGAGASIYSFSFQAARADILAKDATDQFEKEDYAASLSSLDKMDSIGIFYINQKNLFELDREIADRLILETKFTPVQKNYLEKIIAKNEASLAADSSRQYYKLVASRIPFIAGRFNPDNYAKSQALLQTLADSRNRRMEVYMYMAENYLAQGQNDKAIEFGEKAVAIDPYYSFADYSLARLYRLMGNNDKAIQYIDLAIKHNYYAPAINVYYLYADTAVAMGDHDRAIIAFTQLIKLEPDNPQNYANLAITHLNKKDYAKAREISQQMIVKFPKLRDQMQAFIDKIPN